MLSLTGWLTYSGPFTHKSGHPSAVDRAQDRESSPVKDQRSTAVTRNQPAGTQRELTSGGSRTSRSDVNVNTDALDSQQCQTMAVLVV